MPTQALNKSTRDRIYACTLAAVRAEVGNSANLAGHCLEFSWQGYLILKSWPGAPRTIIQAGSAQWPRVLADDGHSPTHFAYAWDADSPIARLFREGIVPVIERADGHVAQSLPEMHVWLGCPDTGEL